MISKMSVARQFMVLAVLGMVLTVTGLGLTLKRSRDLAYEAKRTEIQHEGEEGASIVRSFVQREQNGELTKAEAQKRAIEAVGAIRFQGVNYVALLGFDGVSISNANKNIVGKNLLDQKDPMGHPIARAQIAIGMSGTPGFAEFYWTKIGETTPKLKMSYNIGVPEWQWDVTTGDFADDLDANLWDSIVQLLWIFLPLFLGFIAVVYVMRRSLSNLLSSLSDAMRRLAKGDLDTVIVGLDRRDELGQMAQALVTFRQAAADKTRLERETAEQRQLMGAQGQAAEATQAEVQRQQEAVVTALASGLDRLSRGDLSGRLHTPFPAEYEKLRADFNGAMSKLQDMMKMVCGTSIAIRSGTSEISTAADDLSRRTEQQAASLEQTAAALDEITATVRKTAEGAKHARDLVGSAKTNAEHSSTIVRQAVEAMSGIERSSDEIGNIIGVIDEIAFQTNLLALNAGVEAARAGDAGRGFAVVASEVRALAQRSAGAAKEIKALISASSAQVEQGVGLVDETGKALERILGQVSDINGIVAEIAASAQEQATGLDQVNIAINQMDQVTQQNAAMVEESTAASHALAQETDELNRLISGFDVGDSSSPMRAAPSAQRPARPSQDASRSKTATAMKTVGRQGAVKKLEARAEPEDWKEF